MAYRRSTSINLGPYIDILLRNALRGKEGQSAYDDSQDLLVDDIFVNSPRTAHGVPDEERAREGRNIAHLVRESPDEARKTGGMEVRHYLEVAKTVAGWGADIDTIDSALFHDYVEGKIDCRLKDDATLARTRGIGRNLRTELKGLKAEIVIRETGEQLQDWFRDNLFASYPKSKQRRDVSALRARRLVAINYKLTRNPKNSYLDSMQHLLFPVQGTFTIDDVVGDLEKAGMRRAATLLTRERDQYGDLSRRELEHRLLDADRRKLSRDEAREAAEYLRHDYGERYNLNDIMRVFVVKCADRVSNVTSRKKVKPRFDVPITYIQRGDARAKTLASLLRRDPYNAIFGVKHFYEIHKARTLEDYQMAYTAAKNLLLAQAGKLFITSNFGVKNVEEIREAQPTLYQAYQSLIRTTQAEIRAARERLTSSGKRAEHDEELRKYEEAGFLDEITEHKPRDPKDPHKAYYGFHGTLRKYIRWMEKNKGDMDRYRKRPKRLDLDLAAFDRVLEKLLTQDDYFIKGFTPRAEEYSSRKLAPGRIG